MIVRPATEQDLPWLLTELRAFSAFFASQRPLFGDADYIQGALLGMMRDHLVLVAETAKDGPIGFIAGLLTPHFMNPDIRTLVETLWWVTESHRGSRAGAKLLDAFMQYGLEHADWIVFSLEAKTDINPKSLTKRGFRPSEHCYLLEVA